MKIKDGLILRRIADKNIVVPVNERVFGTPGVMTLNDMSARIWEFLQEDRTFEETLAYILDVYDIDKETAESDLKKLITRMESSGVFEQSALEDIRNTAWSKDYSALHAYAAGKHVPLIGMFELTPRCNFQCKMCYVHMSAAEIASCNAKELTAKEWLHLAEQAAIAGTLYFTLTGGEPLIRDDFEEIYTELSKIGFRLGLNTNGSLITPKYERLFEKYPPLEILITLYGADAGTYQKVCGNPAAYDNVLKGLEFAASLPTRLKLRATFIKDNKDQHKRLQDIAHRYTSELGVNPFVNMPVPGVGADVDSCRLSIEDCVAVCKEHIAYNDKLHKNSDQSKSSAAGLIDGVGLGKPVDRETRSDAYSGILRCNAAKTMFQIKWDGKMYPCVSFVSLYTQPLEEGFKKAWGRLPELLNDLRRPAKCSTCECSDVCTVCPARIEAETGSFAVTSDYICGIVKEMAGKNNA